MGVESRRDVPVHVEIDGAVIIARLNSPPANSLRPQLLEGLRTAVDTYRREGGRALLIASDRKGFFASGADIKHMRALDAEGFAAYGADLRGTLDMIASVPGVSIAVIDGFALGGGLELAMACTLRVGSAGARLGLPEVSLGLLPGAGGTQRLPRLVGQGRALEMILTGREVMAEEAYVIGLLDRLLVDGRAEKDARGLAGTLAAASVPAVEAIMRCVSAAATLPIDEGSRLEASEIQALFETGEAREGIAAFVERRPAAFA